MAAGIRPRQPSQGLRLLAETSLIREICGGRLIVDQRDGKSEIQDAEMEKIQSSLGLVPASGLGESGPYSGENLWWSIGLGPSL